MAYMELSQLKPGDLAITAQLTEIIFGLDPHAARQKVARDYVETEALFQRAAAGDVEARAEIREHRMQEALAVARATAEVNDKIAFLHAMAASETGD